MITVRTLSDQGPYFRSVVYKYPAASLKELIYHVRCGMEDGEDMIAIFHGDECRGIWSDDAEPEPDGEGGWVRGKRCYVLSRPDTPYPRAFKWMEAQFQ